MAAAAQVNHPPAKPSTHLADGLGEEKLGSAGSSCGGVDGAAAGVWTGGLGWSRVDEQGQGHRRRRQHVSGGGGGGGAAPSAAGPGIAVAASAR